jgi:hypothetical protein
MDNNEFVFYLQEAVRHIKLSIKLAHNDPINLVATNPNSRDAVTKYFVIFLALSCSTEYQDTMLHHAIGPERQIVQKFIDKLQQYMQRLFLNLSPEGKMVRRVQDLQFTSISTLVHKCLVTFLLQ